MNSPFSILPSFDPAFEIEIGPIKCVRIGGRLSMALRPYYSSEKRGTGRQTDR